MNEGRSIVPKIELEGESVPQTEKVALNLEVVLSKEGSATHYDVGNSGLLAITSTGRPDVVVLHYTPEATVNPEDICPEDKFQVTVVFLAALKSLLDYIQSNPESQHLLDNKILGSTNESFYLLLKKLIGEEFITEEYVLNKSSETNYFRLIRNRLKGVEDKKNKKFYFVIDNLKTLTTQPRFDKPINGAALKVKRENYQVNGNSFFISTQRS